MGNKCYWNRREIGLYGRAVVEGAANIVEGEEDSHRRAALQRSCVLHIPVERMP